MHYKFALCVIPVNTEGIAMVTSLRNYSQCKLIMLLSLKIGYCGTCTAVCIDLAKYFFIFTKMAIKSVKKLDAIKVVSIVDALIYSW